MRRAGLERVARRVARILGESECLLVGGLAVGAHGYVRATQDVDFVTKLALQDVQKRLSAHGIATRVTRGDVLEGDPCLRGTLAGVRFDVMPALVPIDWERAIELPMAQRAMLRVVDLDGLIRLKLRAGGPKDLMDVAALVLRHPDYRDRARDLAVAYRVADKLDVWLEDPRLRAEMAESRAAERVRTKPVRGARPRHRGR